MAIRTHLPLYKRAFDIIVSVLLILFLSPLFLTLALLIFIESRESVIYYSYRVGRNYEVFKFFKFRSMVLNAENMMDQLSNLNQYDNKSKKHQPVSTKLTRTKIANYKNDSILIDNNNFYALEDFDRYRSITGAASFVKIENDPRITRIGKFIRNTSMDELPQLFNVLIGNMSLVGNRPLPLYEAEKLTTDAAVGRFLAPAGMTGLWQVTERGNSKLDPSSRINLDLKYAKEYNFLMDLKILFMTLPAALQHENNL